MISVAVQMQFDLFEVSKINNLNSKDFINFLLSNNKKVVRIAEGSDGLPVFKINAENIKPSIKAYKNSKKNLIQKLLNI
jgi:hypothetical protein